HLAADNISRAKDNRDIELMPIIKKAKNPVLARIMNPAWERRLFPRSGTAKSVMMTPFKDEVG
ncbi:MAG: hypothetical protein ACE5OR_17720, partial [bacterium]